MSIVSWIHSLTAPKEEPEPNPDVVRHKDENEAREAALHASGNVPRAERAGSYADSVNPLISDHIAINQLVSLHAEPVAPKTYNELMEEIRSIKL